jgi:hypothetical protein
MTGAFVPTGHPELPGWGAWQAPRSGSTSLAPATTQLGPEVDIEAPEHHQIRLVARRIVTAE